MAVLILNGGSTGWKIAVFEDVATDAAPFTTARTSVDVSLKSGDDAGAAIAKACDGLRSGGHLDDVRAVAHRIVHGGARLTESVRIDGDVEDTLRSLEGLAPSHNARELAGITATQRIFAGLPQVAVFDTAFHRTLPPAAFTYPGPYAWRERGIRRFGFHGSSVAYSVERAAQLLDRPASESHLVVAHLGGGCSVTAVRGGESVDTSMGFTPLDGTMMGTRSGAVDPGILTFLMREGGKAGASASELAAELDDTLNERSGLAGISGISGDVRELERAAAANDERAQLALDMFARRAATTIAGMTTSLERVDGLVFTGGIGQHAAPMRARICARLGVTGIALDATANSENVADDATDRRVERGGSPAILVIAAREEWYAARECARVLG